MREKFRYWWTILYLPVYLLCFGIAEAHIPAGTGTEIGLPIDRMIPFVEGFIVPYLLWFPYIAVTFIWFFFRDKKEFLQYMGFLYIGMTVFIIVSFVFPNELRLRPTLSTLGRDNIFIRLIDALYQTDTPTNVLPSIHVYNSVAAAVAVVKSRRVSEKRWQKIAAVLCSASIVLSTMFIKQHSVIDVTAAIALSVVVYFPIYGHDKSKAIP